MLLQAVAGVAAVAIVAAGCGGGSSAKKSTGTASPGSNTTAAQGNGNPSAGSDSKGACGGTNDANVSAVLGVSVKNQINSETACTYTAADQTHLVTIGLLPSAAAVSSLGTPIDGTGLDGARYVPGLHELIFKNGSGGVSITYARDDNMDDAKVKSNLVAIGKLVAG